MTAAALLAADSINPVLSIGLLLVGGLLAGGAWAVKDHNKLAAVVIAVLAVLAVAGGVFWQIDT